LTLLCGTGPSAAAALSDDPNHRACVELLRRAANRGAVVAAPATVLAEAGFLIERNAGPEVEEAFLEGFASPGFEVIALTSSDLARMAELVRQYADFPLGTTDASIIAIAERLGLREVATLDRRHFCVVRPTHAPSFTLLPN
jgi:predicted nucleic acid-binding protein